MLEGNNRRGPRHCKHAQANVNNESCVLVVRLVVVVAAVVAAVCAVETGGVVAEAMSGLEEAE
jgi:hypothetical protein